MTNAEPSGRFLIHSSFLSFPLRCEDLRGPKDRPGFPRRRPHPLHFAPPPPRIGFMVLRVEKRRQRRRPRVKKTIRNTNFRTRPKILRWCLKNGNCWLKIIDCCLKIVGCCLKNGNCWLKIPDCSLKFVSCCLKNADCWLKFTSVS